MALIGPFSLVCWSCARSMDDRKTKIKSLAIGHVGSFSRYLGAIALLLYAVGIRDEPSDELGVHEHKRRIFLLGEP